MPFTCTSPHPPGRVGGATALFVSPLWASALPHGTLGLGTTLPHSQPWLTAGRAHQAARTAHRSGDQTPMFISKKPTYVVTHMRTPRTRALTKRQGGSLWKPAPSPDLHLRTIFPFKSQVIPALLLLVTLSSFCFPREVDKVPNYNASCSEILVGLNNK